MWFENQLTDFRFYILLILIPLLICGISYGLIFIFFLISRKFSPSLISENVEGKTIIVTGASSGLGKSTAKLLAQFGANVILIARGQDSDANGKSRLDYAVDEVKACAKDPEKQTIEGFKLDLKDREKIFMEVPSLLTKYNGIDWVVMSHGCSAPGEFLNQAIQDAESTMAGKETIMENLVNSNLLGSIRFTEALFSASQKLKMEFPERIIYVASVLATVSFSGYIGYCASKYGLRGFVDGLRNELIPYKTKIHLYLPGNMDTPMFENENKTKPACTFEIEGPSKALHPDECARCMIMGALRDRYYITNDVVSEMLRNASQGFNKRTNVVFEVLASPISAIVDEVFIRDADNVVESFHKRQNDKKDQ
jgi:3-dehydrosphinganine reductase